MKVRYYTRKWKNEDFLCGKLFEIVLNLPIQSSSHNVTLVSLNLFQPHCVYGPIYGWLMLCTYVLVAVALRAL